MISAYFGLFGFISAYLETDSCLFQIIWTLISAYLSLFRLISAHLEAYFGLFGRQKNVNACSECSLPEVVYENVFGAVFGNAVFGAVL